ncbi:MAG TPA: 3-oxoacyl-ACP synthase, partial [Caulobacteraceae bacterium]|nr:3-oxoacyl-ACP synthase [Caulobacteraceae bacterium]
MRSVVTGVGGCLPPGVVTNDDLATFVDTNDAWIVERTGIRSRRRAAEDQATSDLAAEAARKALAQAGRGVADVDMILVATTTPDLTFPATAAIVQRKLGAPVGIAFDVQAVCSGFVYALAVADNFVARGLARCALVIGAETMTRLMDWTDRGTCVLFGDGAGAVV